jgi:Mg2+ and Co2+ transporter CorA
MKVLTLATVLLLPASLVAGLLGMNVMVPVPTDDPTVFWRVAAGMAILALTMIGVARARHWI